LSHALHTKADVTKVQELVSSLRNELVGQVASMKRDLGAKSKKKEDEARKKVLEGQTELEKVAEEVKANRDKIQKLAVQFDKELADRDKHLS
jgi:hypothetical protein